MDLPERARCSLLCKSGLTRPAGHDSGAPISGIGAHTAGLGGSGLRSSQQQVWCHHCRTRGLPTAVPVLTCWDTKGCRGSQQQVCYSHCQAQGLRTQGLPTAGLVLTLLGYNSDAHNSMSGSHCRGTTQGLQRHGWCSHYRDTTQWLPNRRVFSGETLAHSPWRRRRPVAPVGALNRSKTPEEPSIHECAYSPFSASAFSLGCSRY